MPPADHALVEQLHPLVADRLSRWRAAQETAGRDVAAEDEQQYAVQLIDQVLDEHAQRQITRGAAPPDPGGAEDLARAIYAALFRLGPLQPLLEDPDVENININGCDEVWLKYADGSVKQGPPVAASDQALIELIQLIGSRMGPTPRRFDLGQPRLHLRLPNGSRLFALMGVSQRPVVSIRRHRLVQVSLDDLVELGTIDRGLHAFLATLVRARKNIVVAGATNAGKTTMLRALINEIPPRERLVTIENAYELGVHQPQLKRLHPDVTALEAREANVEGEGAITMAELVQSGLRLDPDRVIVGEVLGEEILSMLLAMSQGNDGSMCTIHARSSQEVFSRIATYAIKSPERLPIEATNLLIAGAVDMVVFIEHRDQTALGGRHDRYVSSVREVTGADGYRITSNEIYQPGPDGRAVPRPGAPLRCLPDLQRHGFDPAWLDHPRGWWSP